MKGNPRLPRLGSGNPEGRKLPALWRPMVAIALAVFLLTGGLNTLALWGTTQALGNQNLTGADFDLAAGTLMINLHSQITSGQRTFASGTTCSTSAPYTECRDVSSTLASERLVPGDKLTITRTFTVTASGNNLQGELQVDVASLLPNTGAACPGDQSNAYACAATLTASVTNPDASITPITSGTGWQVDRPVTGTTGAGTYTVTWSMAVAPTNAGADWLDALTDKGINFGSLNVTLAQV